MNLDQMTWPKVEDYLKTDRRLLLPIGSTEQHGPTGLIGTDYLTSDGIAEAVATTENVIKAPPLCYGMALHHLSFPGSAALKPSTLITVLVELLQCFKASGFRQFLFVNGHGGNIPTLQAAISEFKGRDDSSTVDVANWWRLPEVQAYETDHFGEANGFHATVGEISVTQHLHPHSFDGKHVDHFDISMPEHRWPLSAEEFRKTFPDGRMGSDPNLASQSHGAAIFKIAVESISKIVRGLRL